MRFARFSLFLVGGLLSVALRAQTSVPTVSQPIPAQTLITGGTAITLDLRNYFSLPGVASQSQVVQFDTVMGRFNVELLANDAPLTVANFLRYVNRGAYNNSFIHRSVPGFVIQGGGYTFAGTSATEIQKDPPVANEFRVPNTRGTLAMAKVDNNPNSATSEWFVNLADNRANLDSQNGGFTVFARVIGSGMSVVDAIASLQRINAGGQFSELPVRNYVGGDPNGSHLIFITSAAVASVFPTGGGASVVSFTLTNSAPNIVAPTLSGSTLTLVPRAAGSATISLRAVDTNNNSAETSFTVTVTTLPPSLIQHPVSQTVATGNTVVFNAIAANAESYQWQRNGVDIPGAIFSTFIINNATSANNGTYRAVAINPVANVTSSSATLSVVDTDPTSIGRLINLSILTTIRAAGDAFSMGYVVGGNGTTGAKPLVLRAAGPSLGVLGVPNTLADPKIEFFTGATKTGENDNWGGGQPLTDAMAAVGAFAYAGATSLDSAALANITTRDNSVRVSAANSGTGTVIAEVYDATPAATVTTSTPRLVNVSVLKIVEANASMTAGFVLRGQTARTVLIRAIGPGLQAAFGVSDVMSDPQLTLFNASSVKIAENDNWGGEIPLRLAIATVGAFGIQNSASRDAMLLMTLAPGAYTAEVKGVGGVGGNVIVEVYEVP
jgi:cyclophilin family peptidyl-prolyl cis-trans isomerase